MDKTTAIETRLGIWIREQESRNLGYTYGVDVGRTYVRVWRRLGSQDSRSVVAFCNLATGLLHRANSWKQPGYVVGTLPVGQ